MAFASIAIGVATNVATGLVSKVFGGGGSSGGGGQAQQVPVESPTTTLNSAKSASSTGRVTLKNDTKVARAATPGNVKYKTYDDKEDPWANTRDWYTSLGGDPKNVDFLNTEDMPF